MLFFLLKRIKRPTVFFLGFFSGGLDSLEELKLFKALNVNLVVVLVTTPNHYQMESRFLQISSAIFLSLDLGIGMMNDFFLRSWK